MTAPAARQPDVATSLVALLVQPASVKVSLGLDYFDRLVSQATQPDEPARGPTPPRPGVELLPDDYRWAAGDGAGPRIPLPLCEFLAYKTALAYEAPERIHDNLTTCCEGISNYAFFDTSEEGIADTQGFGFLFQGKAYVVFRGTENSKDWAVNLNDAMTDTLKPTGDRRLERLTAEHGDLLPLIGDLKPGRHLGFTIAWAAVREQVEMWLRTLPSGTRTPIICSGHSLGGGLALLSAFDFARAERPYDVAAVVTFGAPLVGGEMFAAQYDRLLGNRTVRIESIGDAVPVVMQRWYYRHLYFLRQWAKAGLMPEQSESFKAVGHGWTFAEMPPLSRRDFEGAIDAFRRGLERAAAEERRKQEEAAKQKEAEEKSKAEAAAKPGEDGKPAAAGKETPSWVFWVLGGVVILVIAGVAWYFVRRKLFSHDIQQRYALYLSTLSYQQLRRQFQGDLGRANSELDRHLAFIRGTTVVPQGEGRGGLARALKRLIGREAKPIELLGPKPYFSAVSTLPVRLSPGDDLETFFKSDSMNIV